MESIKPKSEDEKLLEIVSSCSEEQYNQKIAQEKNWAILFHLSHIRENIAGWLPIKKTDRILEIGSGYGEITGMLAEKSAGVTCIETNSQAVQVCKKRHEAKKGICILQGAYQDVEKDLTQAYDWVFLIGSLEHGKEHMNTDRPYEDLLESVKKHLTPEGKVVTAAENRLGLKYFAGCQDEYSDTYFHGIEGCREEEKVKVFSGPELRRMAETCGYQGIRFYYPYPDYKLPMSIYSDEYLPKVGELWDNLRNFDRERYCLFDETKAFDQIIQDGLFPVFTNSFLLILTEKEIKKEKRVIFAKYSNERDRRFAIRTDLLIDEDGSRLARKSACYPEGESHVENLLLWQECLGKVYENSKLELNHCKKADDGIEMDYVTGETLEEALDHVLLQGKTDQAVSMFMEYIELVRKAGSTKIFTATPEFEKVFGEVLLPEGLTCSETTDIDMVASNVMLSGETWIHMDYEWTFDFPIPVNYVIFRMIQNYLYGNVARSRMQHEWLYKKAGLTELEIAQYTKMEQSFQRYITGNHVPLRLLYEDVSPGCIHFHEEEAHRREIAKANAKANVGIDIFVDTFEIAMTGIHVNGWAVSKADRQVKFELQDENGIPLETVKTEYLYRRDVVDQFKLSGKNSKAGFHLECKLASGAKKNKKFTLVARDGIHECRFEIPVEKLRIKQSRLGKKIMDLRGARDVIHYIAPKEMGLFREGKQYRVENQRFDTWRMAHRLSEGQKEQQRKEVMAYQPCFSMILPAGDFRVKEYRRTIESVLRQTWGKSEILAAPGCDLDKFQEMIKSMNPQKANIRVIQTEKSKGSGYDRYVESVRKAFDVSVGEYLIIMNPGDILEDSALYEFGKRLNEEPQAEILYCDSDKIDWDRKEHFDPQFKPDYSPYTLQSGNYIGNSVIFQKKLLLRTGITGDGYEKQMIYRLLLAGTERAERICHLSKLLYHESAPMQRSPKERNALCTEWENGKRILEKYYEDKNLSVQVEWANYPLKYRVKRKVEGTPLVSVLIPNQDHMEDLEKCISSIVRKSTYPYYEILVIENNSRQESTFTYYQKMQEVYPQVRLLTWEREFNYSAINNFAAKQAKGEYLIFLNNDTEILTPEWIEEMLSVCQQPDVGITGAKLYYPDGTIQHAGVILGLGNIAGHLFVKEPGDIPGYMGRACTMQNLSAVTAACMMTEKTLFDSVGGFDETLQVALNDVDYCMKVIDAHKMVVWNPEAELYHYESKSRGLEDTPEKKARYDREVARFQEKWGKQLEAGDPYYNPNLSRTTWNCTYRIPPRSEIEK